MTPEQRARCLELAERLEKWAKSAFTRGLFKGETPLPETLDEAAALLRECAGMGVRVKPLVWEGDGFWSSGPNEGWMEEADTPFGWGYSIEFGRIGNFKVCSTFDWSQDGFEAPDAAKAAAQADYEARILAALEPAPVYLDGWNDALEAAAKVALRHFGSEPTDAQMHAVCDIAAAIRALTPPERPKP
jgi:hypothetical protein